MKRVPEPLEVEPTWKRRLARYLAKVAWRNLPFAVAAALATAGLAKVGLDRYPVVHGLLLASPLMVVALLAFVVHAWRQNTPAGQVGEQVDAEPATPSRVGQPAANQPTVRVVNAVHLPARTSPDQLPSQPLTRPLGAEQPTVAIRMASEPEYAPWGDSDAG